MKLKYINTYTTNPNKNLAFEEYLFENIGEGECILYLWQNKHTVVIGKNQDAYKECRVTALEDDGGYLVRRPSGGGAVYHDMGNLNFTFITTDKLYDVDKQLDVLCEAVRSFGVNAEKSGRNDVCAEGRKFSGNAFLKRGNKRYHHGTILIDVNMNELSKYLNVSNAKLKSKGVSSVKSRVVNLSEFNKLITPDSMRKALVDAFLKVYEGKACEIQEKDMDSEAIAVLQAKYELNEWRFNRRIEADYSMESRFDWGEVSLNFKINGGKISDTKVYSDAMDVDLAVELEKIFTGCNFNKTELAARLADISGEFEEMAADIKAVLLEEDI